MMKFKLSLSFILLLLVVVFTLQNTEVVTIKFLLWDLELSRALLIFLLLGIGVIIGTFLGSCKPQGPKQEPSGQERKGIGQ